MPLPFEQGKNYTSFSNNYSRFQDSVFVVSTHVLFSLDKRNWEIFVLVETLEGSHLSGFHNPHYPIGGHLAIVHSAQAEAAGGIKSTEIWL